MQPVCQTAGWEGREERQTGLGDVCATSTRTPPLGWRSMLSGVRSTCQAYAEREPAPEVVRVGAAPQVGGVKHEATVNGRPTTSSTLDASGRSIAFISPKRRLLASGVVLDTAARDSCNVAVRGGDRSRRVETDQRDSSAGVPPHRHRLACRTSEDTATTSSTGSIGFARYMSKPLASDVMRSCARAKAVSAAAGTFRTGSSS
jgi:hypothetical protein